MDEKKGVCGLEDVNWKNLAETFNVSCGLFENTLFWEGFDISSNVYAIIGDYITIVDPGNDYTAFMELFDLGYKPSDVKKIVLTHGHFEHVMGAFELLRYIDEGGRKALDVILHEKGPDGFSETAGKFHQSLTEVIGGEIIDIDRKSVV